MLGAAVGVAGHGAVKVDPQRLGAVFADLQLSRDGTLLAVEQPLQLALGGRALGPIDQRQRPAPDQLRRVDAEHLSERAVGLQQRKRQVRVDERDPDRRSLEDRAQALLALAHNGLGLTLLGDVLDGAEIAAGAGGILRDRWHARCARLRRRQ